MSALKYATRSLRLSSSITSRPISTSPRRAGSTKDHRDAQINRPLNPHMTNTNSTIVNGMPAAGAHEAPPEFLSAVDPGFKPKDSLPANTNRMTGATQSGEAKGHANQHLRVAEHTTGKDLSPGELAIGELEGGSFKVEPLRRTGEDENTLRARLVYQSRKRGTLEADLLMSTFADTRLEHMSIAQMRQYDLFLDENDWDIYYWATQQPTPTSQETAEGAGHSEQGATAAAAGNNLDPEKNLVPGSDDLPASETDAWRGGKPRSGEWAQTIGTFKPAYRPVPARWRNSEILAMLRSHVKHRSAGSVHVDSHAEVKKNEMRPNGGAGMAFMPPVRNMDS